MISLHRFKEDNENNNNNKEMFASITTESN